MPTLACRSVPLLIATGLLVATASACTFLATPDNQLQRSPPTTPSFHVAGSYSVAEIRHAYGLDSLKEDGTGQRVAVVAAYLNPTLTSDLQHFSSAFHLPAVHGDAPADPCSLTSGPHPCLIVDTMSPQAPIDRPWAEEQAMAVEWIHALAPGADIAVVQARSATLADLMSGVDDAVRIGASVVSMSWGVAESSGETALDKHFMKAGVTFVAAAGDSPLAVRYPAASPLVLAVGGTTLLLDSNGGHAAREEPWPFSSSGVSRFEIKPTFQRPAIHAGTGRTVPDVSWAADPQSGFAVYTDSGRRSGWVQLVGTSASAPQWAALMALIDQRHGASIATTPMLQAIYRLAREGKYRTALGGGCRLSCPPDPYRQVTGFGSPTGLTLLALAMNVS